MSYAVQLGMGGYLGWKLLERTADKQMTTFQNDLQIRRSSDYFAEKMPAVKQADELVSDYRLLQVALRAFGLDNDIANKAFITKVLEADPSDSDSFVNRLSDKRYLSLNKALGLTATSVGTAGNTPGNAQAAPDIDAILDLYVTRSFEKNIGERHQEIEIAMNARRELGQMAKSDVSNNAKWYQILASKPLRQVFEGALGLGSSFGRMPIDRQHSEIQIRLERLTGSSDVSQFADPENLEKVLKYYLIRSQINNVDVSSPYAAALTILRSGA